MGRRASGACACTAPSPVPAQQVKAGQTQQIPPDAACAAAPPTARCRCLPAPARHTLASTPSRSAAAASASAPGPLAGTLLSSSAWQAQQQTSGAGSKPGSTFGPQQQAGRRRKHRTGKRGGGSEGGREPPHRWPRQASPQGAFAVHSLDPSSKVMLPRCRMDAVVRITASRRSGGMPTCRAASARGLGRSTRAG